MKKIIITTAKIVAIICYLTHIEFVEAQQNRDNQLHLQESQLLYGKDSNSKYITNYLYAQKIQKFQDNISGTIFKDGKALSTSAILDDKSLTLNYSFNPKLRRGNLNTQISVTGMSDDGVVNLFSEGKYQQTLTYGLAFQYYLYNSGGYSTENRVKVHNQIKTADNCFKEEVFKDSIAKIITKVLDILRNCHNVLFNESRVINTVDCKNCNISNLNYYESHLALLEKFCCVNIKNLDSSNLIKTLETSRNCIINNYIISKRLEMLEKIQQNAVWSSLRNAWISGNIKNNKKYYPIFDIKSSDDLYTKTFSDNFFSLDLSYNYLYKNDETNFAVLISPTLKYNTQRNFNKDSLLKIQKDSRFIVGNGDTLVSSKATSFYQNVIERSNNLFFDVPFIFYNTESKYGVDITISSQFAPTFKNLALRLGVFVPLAISDKKTITIEPFIKIKNLEKPNLNLWTDRIFFGLVVNVALPDL